MRRLKCVVVAAWLLSATVALAQDEPGRRWPVPGVTPPTTELAMELFVSISPAVAVGASDGGMRRFIPITGGHFTGNGIKGDVMSGGADWQLSRSDGVTEVNALYSIKTDDGAVIVVDNQGIIVPGNGGIGYARTQPRFHAPEGKYQWLNKTHFVGTISPAPQGGAVIIRVFKVL
jgi:hypothetical protein